MCIRDSGCCVTVLPRSCSRFIAAIVRRCARGSRSRIFWKSIRARPKSGRSLLPLTLNWPKKAQENLRCFSENHEIGEATLLMQAPDRLGEQRGGRQSHDLALRAPIETERGDRVG